MPPELVPGTRLLRLGEAWLASLNGMGLDMGVERGGRQSERARERECVVVSHIQIWSQGARARAGGGGGVGCCPFLAVWKVAGCLAGLRKPTCLDDAMANGLGPTGTSSTCRQSP